MCSRKSPPGPRKTTQDAARARSTGWPGTCPGREYSGKFAGLRADSARPGGRRSPRPHRSRTRGRFLGGIHSPDGLPAGSLNTRGSWFAREPLYNLLVSRVHILCPSTRRGLRAPGSMCESNRAQVHCVKGLTEMDERKSKIKRDDE